MSKTVTNPQPVDSARVKEYLVKLFDGIFSDREISEHRNLVYYRIANYASPTSGVVVSSILSQDDIGEVINTLGTLQFNRRMAARAAQLKETVF